MCAQRATARTKIFAISTKTYRPSRIYQAVLTTPQRNSARGRNEGRLAMAKALFGHLTSADSRLDAVLAQNSALRTRVRELSERVVELEELLEVPDFAPSAVGDGSDRRIVDLHAAQGATR